MFFLNRIQHRLGRASLNTMCKEISSLILCSILYCLLCYIAAHGVQFLVHIVLLIVHTVCPICASVVVDLIFSVNLSNIAKRRLLKRDCRNCSIKSLSNQNKSCLSFLEPKQFHMVHFDWFMVIFNCWH